MTGAEMNIVGFPELTNREQEVLRCIIQNFIVTASPVASRTLVERYRLNISSATVRGAMNSLESKGLLDHPHTSSGRVPTEHGYRHYVNSLMQVSVLSKEERQILDTLQNYLTSDIDDAVQSAARILARLSNLLAVVVTPRLGQGVFRKIELVSISSSRVLVVLTIESGIVKTFSVEVQAEMESGELERVARFLNERLQGHKLNEISRKIKEMLSDYDGRDHSGLIRVFIDSADTIFDDHQLRKFHFGGVEYMALQPEFNDLSSYKGIVELLENEDMIIHLFDDYKGEGDNREVQIRIGRENKIQQVEQCSVVSANYHYGGIKGTIGLVGPTRMNYSRMVALVEQLANRFSVYSPGGG
ncbi:heat-inducible transcriptional repressor HrcA [Balneolales bacterium ANBcel1]|nr:heat-inducible transcriptional repressor HrcA [Balneolales bacterium ANBcel1]